MMALLFMLLVGLLFVAIFFFESSDAEEWPRFAEFGLLAWLTSGNWPAKVGGGLLLLGVGALIRYSLIHVDLPAELKLGVGFIGSAVFAAAAFTLRGNSRRRAIYLSLAGTAAGVAYLTAYSAYGFFHFINNINALALLALVAVVTGVFALSSNALSVAILAMAGAYLAPAFALEGAGPVQVYGYYFAVSILTLIMVTIRGWRPLIHLSFLFTLAGALFFGWTAKFYRPEYYSTMQPILLNLVALHLAMPHFERRNLPGRWLARVDIGYFWALPIVAAILSVLIAPTARAEGVVGLILLGLLWTVAAGLLYLLRRPGAVRHAIIAALLYSSSVVCYTQDIPWILIGLGLAVAAFCLAPRFGWSDAEEPLSGAILLFGFLHVAASIMERPETNVFLNDVFATRMVATLLLGTAAGFGVRREVRLASLLGIMAGGWGGLALIIELQRLHIEIMPQLTYGGLLGAGLVLALIARKRALPVTASVALLLALAAGGWWAAQSAAPLFIAAALLLTPAALLLLAMLVARDDDNPGGAVILVLLPAVLLPWAQAAVAAQAGQSVFFGAAIVAGAALLSLGAARLWLPRQQSLHETFLPLHYAGLALVLAITTTLHIECSFWAIAFELLALLYLVVFAASQRATDHSAASTFGTVSVVAGALVLQAMTLRAFGPDEVMTILDLSRMKLPAVVSMLWATLGAGLAWWGVKTLSRATWSAGATLLVAAALKLVLLDFGSLSQLGNIFALIAAGLVFMAVAWLAPLPPKRAPTPRASSPGAPPTTGQHHPQRPAASATANSQAPQSERPIRPRPTR